MSNKEKLCHWKHRHTEWIKNFFSRNDDKIVNFVVVVTFITVCAFVLIGAWEAPK